MTIQLNHTIVASRDSEVAARFLTELFELPDPVPFGPFLTVEMANGVTLDFLDADGDIASQHYAFLVSEAEFDAIYARIQTQNLDHWADPARRQPGQINHHDGGRGVYFTDPDGHFLEIITRPYGSGS